MHHITKKTLSGLNFEEKRWWILERFVQIEIRIDQVILKHIDPSKDGIDFVRNILLNSSILHFWAKIKLLYNIYPAEKKLIEDIRILSNIRNAFAHCFGYGHIVATINPWWTTVSYAKKFKVMDSSGRLKDKEVNKQLEKFYDIYQDVKTSKII